MEYQELINKCKEAYKQINLEKAWKYWVEIYDKASSKFEKCEENSNEFYKAYEEFQNYMRQFTDDEVYTITDYGKSILFSE